MITRTSVIKLFCDSDEKNLVLNITFDNAYSQLNLPSDLNKDKFFAKRKLRIFYIHRLLKSRGMLRRILLKQKEIPGFDYINTLLYTFINELFLLPEQRGKCCAKNKITVLYGLRMIKSRSDA